MNITIFYIINTIRGVCLRAYALSATGGILLRAYALLSYILICWGCIYLLLSLIIRGISLLGDSLGLRRDL